ncbi:hypothetical protein GCM10011344_04920 [Dokdonia pacifica]|uniref:Uncharacterized protein n=1 Tax=Dokdonia pacifica TaxID=1627892 RepID=A0A238ZMA3_9FLAO|nr:hypothetical protein [Dokdonia pacifica]GGG07386.1 hypothetical protein GCM10011344_04920 [Dokdonia pacifica]SNR84497.1 hypothetical protein SAMN06265376_103355 [Dokdonia pacifica]
MTRQIRDRLIYSGEDYYLNEELLEGYFREHPEKKPESKVTCTALWRGYIATFEIKDDQLLVDKLEMFEDTKLNLKIIKELFPNNNKFEWYSGLIRIDDYRGEWDEEPKDGKFEFLEINNGDFIQKREMNFDDLQSFKKEQYEYFILSEDVNPIYKLFKKNNEGITEDRINEIISKNILIYTREVYVD